METRYVILICSMILTLGLLYKLGFTSHSLIHPVIYLLIFLHFRCLQQTQQLQQHKEWQISL